MSAFDDTLAATLLLREAFERGNHGELMQAIDLLFEETGGADRLTSLERERVYRDAAIREACRAGEPYASVAARYGMSPGNVSHIATAAGIIRRQRRRVA
jgi:hypothetical protein